MVSMVSRAAWIVSIRDLCLFAYFSLNFISFVFFDFSLTVKAVPHECVIRTGQPLT